MEPSVSAGASPGPSSPLNDEPRRSPAAEGSPRSPGPAGPEALLLARLLDRMHQPFVVTDDDGRIVLVNRALEDLIGGPAGELIGTALRDLTPGPPTPAEGEALGRLRSTDEAVRYATEFRRRDGRMVPVELLLDRSRDERGDPCGYQAIITDISERVRSERALRDSEERFRGLYDEAPVGYHEIDAEGTIVNVNRTECELLGYSREEMIGRHVFDFMPEDQREASRRAIREKVRGERPLGPIERILRRKDGRQLVVSIQDRLNRDDRGRVVGIRSIIQDITARKQTEAALVASERRARALFDGIEDAVFVHDLEGRILDANPAACRRMGYTREELLALTTRDIDDPEFAAGFEDRLQQQLRLGHLSFEGRHRAKDGHVIPVDINTSLIQFEDRRAILAVMRDITERKALEETRRLFAEAQMRYAQEMEAKNRALTHSEARYRRLTEGCLDAVVVADERGIITLFNPSAERTFGYPAAEVIGRPLTVLMPDDVHEAHRVGFRRYLETRDPRIVGRTVELRGRRKDGEVFPLELSLNAVDVAGTVQFIGSIRDQAERQRMRDMLIQSERLASIGLLSAGVAHEINNPLAYIGNNLAVLERDLKGVLAMMAAYESARDALARAAPAVLQQVREIDEDLDWAYVRDNLGRLVTRTREGVQRVANIVHSLRGLARTSAPKLEETSIPDLIAPALEMVQGRLRRGGITVRVEHAPNLAKVPCLSSQIGQVLLNLLVNAIQAIETSKRVEGGEVRVTILDQEEAQVIEVADNGCGIDPECLPRLFDPFFTTKPLGEGTGLGLSISHGIIAGHGGRIEVESQPDRGTRFRVILPLKSKS